MDACKQLEVADEQRCLEHQEDIRQQQEQREANRRNLKNGERIDEGQTGW